MNSPQIHTGRAAATAATGLATAALMVGGAHADLNGYYTGPDDYTISFSYMPDFDQRRKADLDNGILGLPNDGNMYCVPTSVLNIGAYLGNHGHPDAFPGNENWPSQAQYNEVSLALVLLGIIGNTTPTGGTGLGGMHDQMQYVVPLDKFTVSTHGFSGFVGPNPNIFAQWAVTGSLISTCHGWYSVEGTVGGVPILNRNGGHCLTFKGASNTIFDSTISLRDPANNSNRFTQADFQTREYDWEPILFYRGTDLRFGTRILPSPGDTAYRVLDGYSKVTPKMGVSLTPFEPGVSAILQLAPGTFTNPAQTIQFESIGEAVMEDITFGPDNDRLYGVIQQANGDRLITCTRIHWPEWNIFDHIPLPGPVQLQFADDRSLLTVGNGELSRILVDVAPDQLPDIINQRDVSPRAMIDWDPVGGRVVIFDPDEVCLKFLPVTLEGELEPLFAAADPLEEGTMMSWDHIRGSAWVVKPGSPALLQLTPQPDLGKVDVLPVTLAPDLVPVDVEVDDLGNLLVSDGERWHEFATDADGVWIRNEDSFFDGMPVGSRPAISRSRTNWTPEAFLAEEWINVLPDDNVDEVPDCLADLDGDAEVTFADLLALLAAWGPCPDGAFCSADFDVSGDVDFSDLLSLLAAFGDCP